MTEQHYPGVTTARNCARIITLPRRGYQLVMETDTFTGKWERTYRHPDGSEIVVRIPVTLTADDSDGDEGES